MMNPAALFQSAATMLLTNAAVNNPNGPIAAVVQPAPPSPFIEGYVMFENWVHWNHMFIEKYMMNSSEVQNFYDNNKKTYRVLMVPLTLLSYVAQTIAEPFIAALSVIVLPIIAINKDDKKYWGAAANALQTLAPYLIVIPVCVLILSTSQTICLLVVLLGGPAVMQIIRSMARPDANRYTYTQFFDHKMKTAKAINELFFG